MNFRKKEGIDFGEEKRLEIIVKKSIDAPLSAKENSFYDSEFWGRANSPDDIYLPDSDEVLSLVLAAHEIGHLIQEGKRHDCDLNNFAAVSEEEKRAWDKGWKYLQKYIAEYYEDRPDMVAKIKKAKEKIEAKAMELVKMSEELYLKEGSPEALNYKKSAPEEKSEIIKKRREEFLAKEGDKIRNKLKEIKQEKIRIKPDWEKFTEIVKKAVKDIIKDNEKVE